MTKRPAQASSAAWNDRLAPADVGVDDYMGVHGDDSYYALFNRIVPTRVVIVKRNVDSFSVLPRVVLGHVVKGGDEGSTEAGVG